MSIEFKPIELFHEQDTVGRLVLIDGKLGAVLAQLSDAHGASAGRWFIECAFGALPRSDTEFESLEAVKAWLESRLRD
ncbi:MAG TPA: hypothetical protein VM915_00815 [Verrucomicrobiae bacterium]|jgi:hypothetical protein|nr:hypothetical protein [Verrucomicrobiae bacterium]